jgi:CubicO group peptidase (beta-lactamase class C family)
VRRAPVWSVAALGVVLSGAAPLARAQSVARGDWDAFVRVFDAAMDSDRVVGGAVLLVRDGRIVAHHERGLADRERGQRVDQSTLFHYGSITKTLTAIAIMQLRDRGELSLDDRIVRWVPELRRMHDPYGMMDSITIRMLLSHSAGFQNPTWPYGNGEPWEPFEPTTWNQLVAMMPYQTLLFRPGSRYSYSNPGFIYLARVIEDISGDPWEVYVQKNIFAPLGLTRSYFGATPYYLEKDRANSYAIGRTRAGKDTTITYGRDFDPGITIPNGGWNAPLVDLATYVAFLTDATARDTSARRRYDVVLSRKSLEEMWRPVLPTTRDGTGTATQSVGLSFFLAERNGTRIVGHTGSQAGFLAFLYIDPATKTGVVAAFNTNNQQPGRRSGFAAANAAALELLGGRVEGSK